MAQIRTRTGRPARSVIVDDALQLFQERGIAAVSLADVAGRTGVTKSALYYHFKTKDALVLAALSPLILEISAFCEGPRPSRERADELVDLAVRHREIVLLGDPRVIETLGEEPRRIAGSLAGRLIEYLSPEHTVKARTRAVLAISGICGVISDPSCTGAAVRELKQALRAIL